MITLQSQYDQWHRTVQSETGDYVSHLKCWHFDALKLAPELAEKAVLEVGCGAGDFAIQLAHLGARVEAVDFSQHAIELAQRRAASQSVVALQFRQGDAQELPFADSTFDVVLSCECLEHLPDPQKALREMSRVLKPGGHLVLTTENYSNGMILAWIVAWIRRVPFNSGTEVQPLENFFVFWRVKEMMRNAGLAVQRMTGAHHVFLLLPGVHPHAFVKDKFQSAFLARLFRPFARHFSYEAVKQP